jgi:hypothetical protein
MKKVILRTPRRTRSKSCLDALFHTHFFGRIFQGMDRAAPSVGLFSKSTTKPTKPSKPTENKWIFNS